jgi:hypothetical protein
MCFIVESRESCKSRELGCLFVQDLEFVKKRLDNHCRQERNRLGDVSHFMNINSQAYDSDGSSFVVALILSKHIKGCVLLVGRSRVKNLLLTPVEGRAQRKPPQQFVIHQFSTRARGLSCSTKILKTNEEAEGRRMIPVCVLFEGFLQRWRCDDGTVPCTCSNEKQPAGDLIAHIFIFYFPPPTTPPSTSTSSNESSREELSSKEEKQEKATATYQRRQASFSKRMRGDFRLSQTTRNQNENKLNVRHANDKQKLLKC